MPFTFAHPTIILPLNYLSRRYISLTGLVAGSLAPDFEYFIRMKVQSSYSHTWGGMFWLDLPLALLLTFLFHLVVRNPLILHLPPFLSRRLQPYLFFSWEKRFFNKRFVVLVSILVGIASHLLWDSFTHNQGFFVKQFKILSLPVRAGHFQFPLFKILQHVSTLLGAVVITWSLLQLPVLPTCDRPKKQSDFWKGIFAVTAVMTAIRLSCCPEGLLPGNIIVSAIAAFLTALLIVSFLSRRRKPVL